MILSMTGFGTGKYNNIIVQLSSLNGKYLDIVFKSSQQFFTLQNNIIREIKKRINRGTIEIYISTVKYGSDNYKNIKNYVKNLKTIAKKLGITDTLNMRDLIYILEVQDTKAIKWQSLKIALNIAIDNLILSRKNEGRKIALDLKKIIAKSKIIIKKVSLLLPDINKYIFEKLKEKISKLLEDKTIDETRMLTEIGIIVSKSDINEELKRIQFHFEEIEKLIISSEPVGKKLEFLLQEILREANSISSKINYPLALKNIINFKNEIEKMREHIRNVE